MAISQFPSGAESDSEDKVPWSDSSAGQNVIDSDGFFNLADDVFDVFSQCNFSHNAHTFELIVRALLPLISVFSRVGLNIEEANMEN